MRLEAAAEISWSDLRIDLSGAFIEGVGYVPWRVEVRELVMNGAIVDGFFAMDDLTVREGLSLDRLEIRYRFRVLLNLLERVHVSADDIVVPSGVRFHIGVWQPAEVAPRGGIVGIQNLLTMTGGDVTVSLRGEFARRILAIGGAQIAHGSRVRIVMSDGNAAPKALYVKAQTGRGLILPMISRSLRQAMSPESTFAVMTEEESSAVFDPAPHGMPGQRRTQRSQGSTH